MNLLSVKNLNVSFHNKCILSDFNFTMNNGEIHVIMGPNGVGKSTLAKVLTGNFNGLKVEGNIYYNGNDINSYSVDEIALRGVFLSFQTPVAIAGLTNLQFFKSFVNNKRKYECKPPIESGDFIKEIEFIMQKLNMKKDLLYRFVNDGFSGGEKKKNEILQMFLLKPKLVILDELDSGLDVDSLKDICDAIFSYFSKDNSILIITHYTRILKYIKPNYVHILLDGKIAKTGDINLALKIDSNGYSLVC